mmetsp:Transcript_22499/g.37052  ORF Transcript_22499/g.37052 Transcript_22499/m.37052 type:complete len:312 (+) Transcript_22499:1157-2092(+)
MLQQYTVGVVMGMSFRLLNLTRTTNLIPVLAKLLDSAKTSGTPGTDKTNLTSSRGLLANSGGTTNVLVVTSSEGMLHGVLSNTTNLGPAVTLHGVLVVGTSSLKQRLVGTSTSGNNTDLGTDIGLDSLLSSRRKAETGGSLVLIVGDDNSEAARSTGKSTTVTNLGLNVAHNGTLGHLAQRKNISNGQGGLLSAVDELTGVHTLSSNHKLSVPLVTVSIQELDLGNGSTTTRVVHDVLDNTTDVSTTFSVVDGTKLHGSLAGADVSLEDGGLTLPLCLLFISISYRYVQCTVVKSSIRFMNQDDYALSIEH